MITLNVLCTGKNSRLEGEVVVTDITFQPSSNTLTTPPMGAEIGVPNPNAQGDLQQQPSTSYTLVSGGFSVNIRESKEADSYQIGQKYQVAINSAKK